ncbi:MAG TPA: polyamine ABC transporter substrate-binding protein [Propionibacteriaceae bacterium]|nr:spermidine/putrescine ABC transporter substrate-binding protein [Micropruina sp.]HBX82558.1 polyamine ABC transporter substrate-binding protein [Propionibacteriaceae bacterium]HBY24566.1 polyamine ABC transporter substrate-binding protein [Propionibacteriaceae bacterium]
MSSRPAPTDPTVRALVSMVQSGLTRRRMLGLGGGAAAAALLAACAPPTPPAAGKTDVVLPKDLSATDKVINWANWTAYLDVDDATKTHPTLEAFQKATGITVNYSEDIDDNNTYFNKIAPQLREKQAIGRDLFVFTDWMANRVLREGLAQPLDLIQMPHAPNLLPSLREVSFDPGRRYSLPWQGGFGGIGYNKNKLGRDLKNVSDLWAPDLKGKVVVLSEFRDTAGLIMQANGVDISGSFTKAQVQTAFEEVSKHIADGSIRRVKGNSYLEDLKSGNAIAGIVWSGDLATLKAETEDDSWTFVLPESGGTIWTDNMMIPITSAHRSNTMKLMDYYYQPEVAAQVAAYVNYICPVLGAQEELAKTDATTAANPFIFPTDTFLTEQKVQAFRALTSDEDADYSTLWSKVLGE